MLQQDGVVRLSWDDIGKDCEAIYKQILQSGKKYDGILAVARGGLPIAGYLSYFLEIKKVETICLSSYDENNQQAGFKYNNSFDKQYFGSGKGWLLVDDLSDTGLTISHIKEMFPDMDVACNYAKTEGKCKADYVSRIFNQDCWVVFPWDEKPSVDY